MTRKSRPNPSESRTAEIRSHGGNPTLFAGQRPMAGIAIDIAPDTTPAQIERALKAGIRLFRVCSLNLGWQARNRYDYAPIVSRIEQLLKAGPQVKLLLEIDVNPPDWWIAENRPEIVGWSIASEEIAPAVSFASLRWQQDLGEALGRLLRHLGAMEESNRILGVQIAAGANGGWQYPRLELLPDIGEAMTRRFRQFLADKYRRNVPLLRKTWFDTTVDFAGVTCPGLEERRRADYGALRGPRRSQRMLDYYECLFEAQSNAALHFCKIARHTLPGRVVGLTWASATGHEEYDAGGHRLPEAVLDSEDIDFIVGPLRPDAPMCLPVPNGSLQLRGKYLLITGDKAIPAAWTAGLAVSLGAGASLAADIEDTELAEVVRAAELALREAGKQRARTSRTAVVVDFTSLGVTSCSDLETNWLNRQLLTEQLREIALAGAPYDLYLSSDLFRSDYPEYPVTFFLNSIYLSEAERRQLDARIKRSGKLACFGWGAGMVGEEGINANLAERVTGQKSRTEADRSNLRTKLVQTGDSLIWGQRIGAQFGCDRPIAPTITISDRSGVRLGANTGGKTNFSVRRFDHWTSVVFWATPMPAQIVQNLLRSAHNHLYAELKPAWVAADSRSLVVCAHDAGTVTLSLPGLCDVCEMRDGVPVATSVTELTLKMRANAIRYFKLIPIIKA